MFSHFPWDGGGGDGDSFVASSSRLPAHTILFFETHSNKFNVEQTMEDSDTSFDLVGSLNQKRGNTCSG